MDPNIFSNSLIQITKYYSSEKYVIPDNFLYIEFEE